MSVKIRLVALALVLILGAASDVAAQTTQPTNSVLQTGDESGVTISLKDALEKGLKARRPEEFQFIARVVTLVELGVLPKRLVQTTFFWARAKPRVQAFYFERALKVRARRLGIFL